MGKQLDSLADVVSFGVAPGLILYQLIRISFAKEENGLDVSIVWLLPALLIPCAAAWRLAKFNLDESQTFSFRGLPTPVAGIVIASSPLIIFYQQFGLETSLTNKWILYLIIIVLSYLMISNLRFLSMKFKNLNAKENFPKFLLIIFGIIALIFLKAVAIPVILIFYILVSLIFPKGPSDKKNIA
jgi:CDP-diacylglycerol--serine O-phosphatidyltransferase